MLLHSTRSSQLNPPQSRFYHGPFGRLFRNLPPHDPLPGGATEAEKETMLNELAILILDQSPVGAADDNQAIPAGYTYFGQYIGHDITFDPTSSLQRHDDPDQLHNFRTPRFDLDSLYANGPIDSGYMYDQDQTTQIPRQKLPIPGFFLLGLNQRKDSKTKQEITTSGDDLLRNSQGKAIIGDPRNDETLIISQLHLAFIKFHNRILEDLSQQRTIVPDFRAAQRILRWHYQYVIAHDFLKRLVGQETFDRVFPADDYGIRRPKLHYYKFKAQPFIPVEFSAAAYRFGHSMIRRAYTLNDQVKDRPIFDAGRLTKNAPFKDLRGGRVLPRANGLTGKITWDYFLPMKGSTIEPQPSKTIDTRLTIALFKLPPFGPGPSSLVARDLIRGWRLGLPSGQSLAKVMGLPIQAADEIAPDDGNPLHQFLRQHGLHQETPLWYYILREAELTKSEAGGHLGPVGGTLVAEVILGILAGDGLSYLNLYPAWTPAEETALETIKAVAKDAVNFELADLIYYATQ